MTGKDSVGAIAAQHGKAKAAEGGCFALAYCDEKTGWNFVIGKVGGNVKADTWYEVKDGALLEIK